MVMHGTLFLGEDNHADQIVKLYHQITPLRLMTQQFLPQQGRGVRKKQAILNAVEAIAEEENLAGPTGEGVIGAEAILTPGDVGKRENFRIFKELFLPIEFNAILLYKLDCFIGILTTEVNGISKRDKTR